MATHYLTRARTAWRVNAPATALVAVYLSIWAGLLALLNAEG